MSDQMSTGEVLSQALDWLKKDGWTTHLVQNEQGQMCAVGAVARALTGDARGIALGNNPQQMAAYVQATSALAKHIPEGQVGRHSLSMSGVMVCSYNNSRTSFEEEIVPWFEKAIANEGIPL